MDWKNMTYVLIGSVLTVLISSLFNILSNNIKYKREIRKSLIKRRIEGYEAIEDVIGTISLVVQDNDKKRYHLIFSREESFKQFFILLGIALKFSLWYSPNIIKLLSELNQISMLIGKDYCFDETSPNYLPKVEMGKNKYEEIWIIKTKLQEQIGKDYMSMHKTDYKLLFNNSL